MGRFYGATRFKMLKAESKKGFCIPANIQIYDASGNGIWQCNRSIINSRYIFISIVAVVLLATSLQGVEAMHVMSSSLNNKNIFSNQLITIREMQEITD